MTRRSSKIQNEEEITAKKPVRKIGQSKKGEVLKNKKTDIRVKVTKSAAKATLASDREDDKAAILEEIKASYARANEVKIINDRQPSFRHDSRAIYEREERKKIMIMWLGVGIFMVIIAGFWIYDTRKIFEQNKLAPVDAKNDFSFDKLGESVKEVSSKLDEFKQEMAKASSTMATTTLDQNIIATSTASSTILSDLVTSTEATSTAPKPELIVKELQAKLMASSTESGKVKGVYEERDIIKELKNRLEK